MSDAMREEFEKIFPMPPNCTWTGNGYAATDYGAWNAHDQQKRWEGFKAAKAGQALQVGPSAELRANGIRYNIAPSGNGLEIVCATGAKMECEVIHRNVVMIVPKI